MKLFALLALLPLAVLANDVPGTAPKTPPTKNVQVNAPQITNIPTAVATGGNATGGSVGNVSAQAGAYGGYVAGVTAGNSLNIEQERSAYAPDVISYPTAHCRIAIGGSGGNGIVSLGFSGSVLDENCELIELSKHATLTLGQKEVGTQIMCLSPKVRQVYDAMGIKCLVALPPPAEEPVKP